MKIAISDWGWVSMVRIGLCNTKSVATVYTMLVLYFDLFMILKSRSRLQFAFMSLVVLVISRLGRV